MQAVAQKPKIVGGRKPATLSLRVEQRLRYGIHPASAQWRSSERRTASLGVAVFGGAPVDQPRIYSSRYLPCGSLSGTV